MFCFFLPEKHADEPGRGADQTRHVWGGQGPPALQLRLQGGSPGHGIYTSSSCPGRHGINLCHSNHNYVSKVVDRDITGVTQAMDVMGCYIKQSMSFVRHLTQYQ